ncbi:MAG: hypothetical protein ACYCXN_09185 [Acidimicrobiales bacterium]|jgi:hypothetical protein
MAAALALAIMLAVVVAVISLAVNSQAQVPGAERTGSTQRGRRAGHPGAGGPAPRTPRRPQRERPDRGRAERPGREAPPPQSSPSVAGPERQSDPDQVFGDLRPLNKQASAVILSVVDERTLGPVTRCRLSLRVEPTEGNSFEVTTRIAFQTPEERARVKVGAKIPVRYDSEDHRRVVVEPETPGGS